MSYKILQEKYTVGVFEAQGPSDPRSKSFDIIADATLQYLENWTDVDNFSCFEAFFAKLDSVANMGETFRNRNDDWSMQMRYSNIQRFMEEALLEVKNINRNSKPSGNSQNYSEQSWYILIDIMLDYPTNFFKPAYNNIKSVRDALNKGQEEHGLDLTFENVREIHQQLPQNSQFSQYYYDTTIADTRGQPSDWTVEIINIPDGYKTITREKKSKQVTSTRYWNTEGKYHRLDGPASIFPPIETYYINGKKIENPRRDFENEVEKYKALTKDQQEHGLDLTF